MGYNRLKIISYEEENWLMSIQIIQVPYDSGHKGIRTGRGPDYLLQRGVDQILRARGHKVEVRRIESSTPFPTEIGTAFELNRMLAETVRFAIANQMLPIVLAGNCNSCLGTIAGIDSARLGIVWFDAHGDFNTPETTVSGFLDGMGLAMAAGRCWRSLLGTIPGYKPIPEANIVHVGARDLDAEEEKILKQADVQLVTSKEAEGVGIGEAIRTALIELKKRVDRVYLHVDLDVLDTGEARPNHLAVPGGLPVELVEQAIGMVRELFEVCAYSIASFDPDYDKGDRVLQAGVRLLEAFVPAD
jgi:arginase